MRSSVNFHLVRILIPFLMLSYSSCTKKIDRAIIISENASEIEILAAREIRRNLYLRTDNILAIYNTTEMPTRLGQSIIIGNNSHKDLIELMPDSLARASTDLAAQQYFIHFLKNADSEQMFVAGADDQAVLYGSYCLAEKYGIGFYLYGDVIPDDKIDFYLPDISVTRKPLFDIRGILPFHDFPEGPDWWNLQDYKFYISQLAKLQMNFIGFHTYPENYRQGSFKAEPFVWIGPESDVLPDGSVKTAYPVLHFNTGDTTWGYTPANTSNYSNGAYLIFERDQFGPDYLPDISPWPHTEKENLTLFNNFGHSLKDALSFAQKLGIKTCTGTESPLIIPEQVRYNLDPDIPQDSMVSMLYRGMFDRIVKTHPLDYFWLWTPETWTWHEVTDEQVENTENDIQIALEAARNTQAPFTLATCGWVLGPPRDRAEFDEILPVEMPFSCINRYVGFARIEPAFRTIKNRSKWAIPWLEDDPGLISPQLWAGRMRKDAYDALEYECDGLIGIHWRTRVVDPTLSALAKAGWQLDTALTGKSLKKRDLPVEDFYLDWVKIQFGAQNAGKIARIFMELDGGPEFDPESGKSYEAYLYRGSHWNQGPGAVKVNPESWESLKEKFEFIEELEKIRNEIKGAGNLERYDFWLNTFRFARETVHLGCLLGKVEHKVKETHKQNGNQKKFTTIQNEILPMRIEAARLYDKMMGYLLQTVTNSSELGTIANLEQHNRITLKILSQYDSWLEDELDQPLPAETNPSNDFHGKSRIIVQAPRSILEKGENLNLIARIVSEKPVISVKIYWKSLGYHQFKTIDLSHINRNVYELNMDNTFHGLDDFEYYIEAELEDGEILVFPPAAPEINQTVIVF